METGVNCRNAFMLTRVCSSGFRVCLLLIIQPATRPDVTEKKPEEDRVIYRILGVKSAVFGIPQGEV